MIKTYKERKLIIEDKVFYPLKDVLIFDIETATIDKNKSIMASNAKFKIWGAFSYNTGFLNFGHGRGFQKLVDSHRIIVGHNIKDFDIPVLERDLGINFNGKIIIDTLEVFRKPPSKAEKEAYKKKGKKPIYGKGRSLIIGEARQIGMVDNRFPDFKLSTIAKHGYKLFKNHPVYSKYFTEYKDEEFEYSILDKEELNVNEWAYVKEYLRQDIVVNKNIFEFLEKYFESFAEDLSDSDIINLDYMHTPTGTYAYKAICHQLNLPFEYGDNIRAKFLGAYVKLPTQEKYTPEDGDGYCVDFASQHPHNIWSANLATPIEKCKHKVNGTCPNPYSGDGEIFKLEGIYCGCEMGDIEKWIRYKFFIRNVYRRKFICPDGIHLKYGDCKVGDEIYWIDEDKNLITKKLTEEDVKEAKELDKLGVDPKEYSTKILINSSYGILSSPIFKSLYNPTTGPDTTIMSRQSTQFMSKWFEKHDYIVTYSDTDSCYIMDPFHDKERMKKVMAEGIQKIRDALPFSDSTYDMDIDAEFSHIFFFQDKDSKDKHYKKKNYIYILQPDENGNVKVKINGLPILKSNAPLLAKRIYLNYLEKEIKRTKNIKFDKDYIRQLIQFEIEKGIDVLISKIKVNPANSYATESQLQAQISLKYFDGMGGIFEGIKHKRKGYGVGKGKFYCSMEEAKLLGFHELDLDAVWKALDPFVKEDKQTNIFDF